MIEIVLSSSNAAVHGGKPKLTYSNTLPLSRLDLLPEGHSDEGFGPSDECSDFTEKKVSSEDSISSDESDEFGDRLVAAN